MPDDQRVHNYLLAYASDFHFLFAAPALPRGLLLGAGHAGATIDHSMWFHREFRLDDWLLYVVGQPERQRRSGSGRGQFSPGMGWWRAPCRKGDPPPGRRPPCATKTGADGSLFLLPALSGCVLLGAECWLAPGEAVGPGAMTPSPVTLQAVPKLSWAR